MRPISGFSSCAARSSIDGCARCAARRFTRIWTTWIAESLAEGFGRASTLRRGFLLRRFRRHPARDLEGALDERSRWLRAPVSRHDHVAAHFVPSHGFEVATALLLHLRYLGLGQAHHQLIAEDPAKHVAVDES